MAVIVVFAESANDAAVIENHVTESESTQLAIDVNTKSLNLSYKKLVNVPNQLINNTLIEKLVMTGNEISLLKNMPPNLRCLRIDCNR
jgi:hypothetical protein